MKIAKIGLTQLWIEGFIGAFATPKLKKTRCITSSIKAEDKTPKRDRIGNFYHEVRNASKGGILYTKLVTLHYINSHRA